MDVRGKVFCHLVNLYNMEAPSEEKDTIEGMCQVRGKCRLSFGWLSWESTHEGHMVAKFEPDTIRKLNGRKEPLGVMGLQLGNSLWAAYRDALEQGISDPKMVWLDPKITAFPKRLTCLITNLALLRGYRPLILTRAWLEYATRIKVRTMLNGGKDNAFLVDVYKTLAEHPSRQGVSTHQIQAVGVDLRSCFFFENDRFALTRCAMTDTPSETLGPSISHVDILERTLEAYSTEDPKSWKGLLYASRDLVIKVALMDTMQRCSAAVNELAFGPGDPLWSTRVHL